MTYPLSSDVSAGQPTAVDHYNNLRADSLRFGQLAADAVNVGALLSRFEDNLNLAYLATNRVRVVATATSPVSLVVNGVPLRTIANVDLPVGSTPSGVAATYYVFAIRSAGSTTFTLDVNTSSTEWTDARRIGSFYWDGSALVQNSIRTDYRNYLASLLNFNPPQAAAGRLTLTSALAVTVTDVTGSTLYFTPFKGSTIDLYSPGFGWVPYTFAELSLSFTGVAAGGNYDIFAYFDGTNVVIEKVAWSNDTTRATALVLQNGRYVKSGATDRLYLGTVRTSATSNIADTLLQRYLWNYFNRVPRILKLRDTTASWTKVTDATWTQQRATAANKVEFVIGVSENPVLAKQGVVMVTGVNLSSGISIGLDAVNAPSADALTVYAIGANSASDYGTKIAYYNGYPGIGYHYLAPIKKGDAGGTATFIGNNGANDTQLMEGTIWS